jgi:hypothetical protein
MSELDDLRGGISDPESVIHALHEGLTNSHSDWDDGLEKISMAMPSSTTAPARTFQELSALLQNAPFLALEKSWCLPYWIRHNWEWFERKQQENLSQILVQSFGQFGSYMGAFVIGEILGECCSDRKAWEALEKLASIAPMPARALVPHGLETLARETTQEELRGMAIEKLRGLARDREEEVSAEARTSLKALGAHF